jgi:hypothetical protein
MRTAVLFTGQERTLSRTVGLLKRNLLVPHNATVFLAVETTAPDSIKGYFDGVEIGGADVRDTFRTPEFKGFIAMLWSSSRPALLEKVFVRCNRGGSIDYIFESGTLLQYYQIWKAWMMLLDYEQKHKMKFDVVVRCRPDCLLTEKLNLASIFSKDEITCRSMGVERIRSVLTPTNESMDKVVLTLGFEQFWVAQRDVFALLGSMLLAFGCWDNGTEYAFNSECFFDEFCKMNHITHWAYIQGQLFNFNHPGTGEVVSDPQVFSLLR